MIEKNNTNTLTKLLPLALLLLTFLFFWWPGSPDYTDECVPLSGQYVVCATSDMAKIEKTADIPQEHPDLDLAQGRVTLHAARNETIAMQLIIRRVGDPLDVAGATAARLSIASQGWTGTSVTEGTPDLRLELFEAHYHHVENGGYTWGPGSKGVLAWPGWYPDALVPQQHGCGAGVKALLDDFKLPVDIGNNQAIWVDIHVASEVAPDTYTQNLTLSFGDHTLQVPLQVVVGSALLPASPVIHAVGEIYRAYRVEGVGYDTTSREWRDMSHCYQQLAHQHRMVFIERTPAFVNAPDWSLYDRIFGPVLTGELFTAKYGYSGTGEGVPVGVWRTPWPQAHNTKLSQPMSQDEIATYAQLAQDWSVHANNAGWDNTEFFAYVFDEVDGPNEIAAATGAESRAYVKRVHDDMEAVQRAIDLGTGAVQGAEPIDLIWTSHSNPSIWSGDSELDLADRIRLWAPNASAADTRYLAERMSHGDKAWFYHSGPPSVGAHAVNFSGIDMRTWGVIGARYGFQGQFMWAVNLGNNDKPFAEPSYKPNDDRFGNGVIVYPGNALPKIGYPASPGPMPSMRMKLWRRGLQDADLYYLALENNAEAARKLIRKMMPRALSAASAKPSWSYHSSDWIEFHKQLLRLAGSQ